MIFKAILVGFFVAVVVLAIYVRVAPLRADAWHKTFYPRPPGSQTTAGAHFVVREVADAQATLEALDQIILETPRTQRIAGSVGEGLVTYVTRSALWRFPDYTTVYAGPNDMIDGGDGPILKVHGRLRFGQADLGVNAKRITGWLAALDAGA